MKKLIISFIFLILISKIGISQTAKVSEAEITVGKPYEVIDAYYKMYIIKDGKILSFKRTMSALKMQLFDLKTLTELQSKDITDIHGGYSIECIKEFKGTIFLFYSLWDNVNLKEQLFCREIDFNKFSFKGQDRLLATVDGKVTQYNGQDLVINRFTAYGAMDIDKFNIQTSYDSTKVLIQYRKAPTDKKDITNKDIIGLYVFNNAMELINGKEYTMPYTDSRMDNIDYLIDSDGNVYTLATVFNEEDDFTVQYKDGKPNFHLELICLQQKTKDFRTTKFDLGINVVNNFYLFEKSNKQICCAGFYNEVKNIKYYSDIENASGIMMFKTDKNGEARNFQLYKFSDDVLNQNASKKEKDKNKETSIAKVQLRQLVLQKDGSMIIVGEQFYYTGLNKDNNVNMYQSHYLDMVITKIDPNDKLVWTQRLPKRQQGMYLRGNLSCKYINSENNHYLVFIDNIKNLSIPPNKQLAIHQEGVCGYVMAYKISDAKGDVSKIPLFNTKEYNGMKLEQFRVDRILKTQNDEFVIEFYKNQKEDILIKANFNKEENSKN